MSATTRRAAVTLLVAAALLVGAGIPALAHTSLAASTPAHRSLLEQGPARVELVFSSAIDPQLVSAQLLDATGAVVPGTTPATTGGPTTTVAFTLPPVEDGAYGVAWQSLGSDGHRVTGEVLFGVGAATLPGEGGTIAPGPAPAARVLDVAAGVARFVWYAALSLLAGALFWAGWAARRMASASSPAAATLAAEARRWRRRALALALGTATARLVLSVALLAGARNGGGAGERVAAALGAPISLLWLAAAAVLAGALAVGNRAASNRPKGRSPVSQTGNRPEGRFLGAQAAAAGAFCAATVLGVLTGHAASSDDPLGAVVFGALHLGAAAAWVGPLMVVSIVALAPAWRAEDAEDRRSVLAACFAGYARMAGWVFAVLALSGLRLAVANLGWPIDATPYALVLAVKVALVLAVVAPLGWAHHRAARRPQALLPARFLPSVRTEAVVLVGVLGLGAAMAGLPPEPPAAPTAVAGAPTDVDECADLALGKPDCYRAYFAGLLETVGATAAVTEIEALAATDDYVANDCHQVAHDLGNAAADFYPTLGEALAEGGAACWSGYYHGVVEARLSDIPDAELAAAVPTLCSEAAEERYSFTHYNCMHGLGHGLMLRGEADLFATLDVCGTLPDAWEAESCVSGAFMENIVTAQHGDPAAVSGDDLLYPCTAPAIEGALADQCYLMQTSYALWALDYDYEAVFALCDGVDGGRDRICYQSMGRDISGLALLDPAEVVAGCDLGAPSLRESCVVGAALNAVYDEHGTAAADALCAAVDPAYLAACETARDSALASF